MSSFDLAGFLMGDDIETGRSMSSESWAAHIGEKKGKKTDIDDRPESMSSPIITQLSFDEVGYPQN